jgi:hypothetical protein
MCGRSSPSRISPDPRDVGRAHRDPRSSARRGASGPKLVAVPSEVLRPQLRPCIADRLALANDDLVGVAAESVAFGAVTRGLG